MKKLLNPVLSIVTTDITDKHELSYESCGKCRALIHKTDKFCPECGRKIKHQKYTTPYSWEKGEKK